MLKKKKDLHKATLNSRFTFSLGTESGQFMLADQCLWLRELALQMAFLHYCQEVAVDRSRPL